MNTYDRIKKLCKDNGTNITKLCIEITGSNGNSTTWKKGNIRNDYLIKIAEKFNVSTDYLLCKTDDPTPPNKKEDTNQPEGDYIFIIGKSGVRQKYPVPHEKVEQFRKLLDVIMPEILANEEDNSDL